MNISLTSTLHEQVTPEYLAAVDMAITSLEQASEFAISLTTMDRMRLRGFGPSSESFVPDVIDATTLHADLVPARCGAVEIAARHTATVALLHRVIRLEELRQRLSDTARVTGDGCVSLSLDAYQGLKRVAQSEGIEATVDRLARRFEANAVAARKPRKPRSGPAATTTGASASPAPSSGTASNIMALPAAAAPLAQTA